MLYHIRLKNKSGLINTSMKYITRFVLYTLLGWKTKGHFPKDLKKYLLIAAPHTHWLDFPLGMAVKWAEGLPANYIGKASLFEPPFGFFFRWLGGAPVVRNSHLVNPKFVTRNPSCKLRLKPKSI